MDIWNKRNMDREGYLIKKNIFNSDDRGCRGSV